MANIGSLSVSIFAKTSKFRKGLKQVTRDIKKVARSVASIGGAFVGLAIGGGLGFFVKRQFEMIDATAKAADKLGVQTKALRGLQFAANLTGVKTDTMNMALQRMVRRVSEAAMGTGEAKDALKELGVDAQALNKLPVSEQFMAIADAMQNVTAQGDRVRLGFKLFDSEGVALVNTLRGGSEQLKEQAALLDKLGGSFNRIDAAKIEEANDSITRVSEAVGAIGQQIAFKIAPTISLLADKFVAAASEGEGMASKIDSAFSFLGDKVDKLITLVNILQTGFFTLKAGILATVSALTRFNPILMGIDAAFKLAGREPPFNFLADRFGEKASESLGKGMKKAAALNGILFGGKKSEFATTLRSFVEKAEKRANELATTAAASVASDASALITGTGATDKSDFQQVDLRRTAIGGLGGKRKEQIVKDPQLETTNKTLIKIERNLNGGRTVTAVAG